VIDALPKELLLAAAIEPSPLEGLSAEEMGIIA